MIIIGVDFHPSVQQVAYVDTETGETCERRLNHSDGEAERFYRDLERRQVRVRVGIEATGHARWFERLLAELKFELWIGDAAKIKAARVRKQKTDRQDELLLLKLLIEDRFPQIWVPSPENRDLRQLIWHRHRLVQMRTRAMNQIQAAAMNEGVRRKKTLWSKTRTKATGGTPACSVGHTAPTGPAGVGGSIEHNYRRAYRSSRAGGTQTARGAAADDASRRGAHHSAGLCAGDWISGSLRLRPSDR